jgi:3'-phosphoadenosine 5'-phosphosulfate sulfotransferase (PAPS reductase)/FAD synthetase
MNPYLLPDGNVQIAFSGGRTSAYMLRKISRVNPDFLDRIAAGTLVVSFQNTGREMPQTLDFVQEVGERWNVPIVWLEYRGGPPVGFEIVSHNSASRNGEPFADMNRRKQMLPNIFQAHCSAQLKTLTAKRYLVSIGWKRWASAVGFRADEAHREPRADTRATAWLPLRAANVTKLDVALFWRQQPFDLRLPIFNGKTIGGNCDGCFKKSEAQSAALARDYPERHAWWENEEVSAGGTFSKRFSRASIRRMVEAMGPGLFSDEAYLCQKDDGECM